MCSSDLEREVAYLESGKRRETTTSLIVILVKREESSCYGCKISRLSIEQRKRWQWKLGAIQISLLANNDLGRWINNGSLQQLWNYAGYLDDDEVVHNLMEKINHNSTRIQRGAHPSIYLSITVYWSGIILRLHIKFGPTLF